MQVSGLDEQMHANGKLNTDMKKIWNSQNFQAG